MRCCFPTKAVESAAASFPFLDEMTLHSELSVIYSNALAMLSIEENLARDSINFNQNVIYMFAQLKNRRAKFLFK